MVYNNEKRSKKMSLSVTPSNYDKLKNLVKEDKIKSMSDFVNYLIEAYFEQQEKK